MWENYVAVIGLIPRVAVGDAPMKRRTNCPKLIDVKKYQPVKPIQVRF